MVLHPRPEKLGALASRPLPKAQPDLRDAKPSHYRLRGNPFVLYSVGMRHADEDGEVVLWESDGKNLDTGDQVWRYAGREIVLNPGWRKRYIHMVQAETLFDRPDARPAAMDQKPGELRLLGPVHELAACRSE
jgi:hypothetical protein